NLNSERTSVAAASTAEPVLQRQSTGGAQTPPAQSQSSPSTAPGATGQSPPRRADLHSLINIQRNGFGRYDAELDRRPAARGEPCRLTLSTTVQFNPQGAWPAGRFQTWQQEFIRVVRDRWSFRFLLAPTQPCQDEPCRLATAIVNVVPVTSNAYHAVNVDYVHPEGARSNVATPG